MSLQLNFSDNLLMTVANTSAPFSGKTPRHTESVPGLWAPGELTVQGAERAAREDGSGALQNTLLEGTLFHSATLACKPAPCVLLFLPGTAPGGAPTHRSRTFWVPEPAQKNQGRSKGFFHQLMPNRRKAASDCSANLEGGKLGSISALPIMSFWS